MGDDAVVQAIVKDYRNAPIDPAFATLLTLIEKVARNATEITTNDIDAVRAVGWTDEAIYDAITVSALFAFYTTWVDSAGVKGLDDYKPSATQLAAEGYLPRPSVEES